MVESLTPKDLSDLTSWHSNWQGLNAVVVGLGQTGFAILDTLAELGATVTALAAEADPDVVNIATVLNQTVVIEQNDERRGELAAEVIADVAVVSPGVDVNDPAVLALAARRVPIWSDVDFAWRVRDKTSVTADWVVVSGENYGSQAAELAARIGQADRRIIAVSGFGAQPLLDLIRDPIDYQTIILSASTKSLGWWGNYRESGREPLVSVLVELDVDSSAASIFEGTRQACVYWRGAGPTESFVEAADVVEGARAIGVGADSPGMSDIGLVEGIVCDRAFLDDRLNQALEISTLEELAEAGFDVHTDLPAILAAIAIARALDISPALIAGVLSLP
jgi:UDP-N-acetylmuramoylalanine--D-glutamate ligase